MIRLAAAAVVAGTLVPAVAFAQSAATPSLTDRVVGNTVSAFAYVGRSNASGGGSLRRIMFQAYLRKDGSALVRVWDPARDAYTAPTERTWTVTDSTLCIGVPQGPDNRICADVHVWGPRIAGASAVPYAMLDGDIKEGNKIDGRP